jgi:hypothetical protein
MAIAEICGHNLNLKHLLPHSKHFSVMADQLVRVVLLSHREQCCSKLKYF